MIADAIKIGAKIAALIAGVALFIVVFNSITLPITNMSIVQTYLNKVYTICLHFVPNFQIIWNLGVLLFDAELAVLGAWIGSIAFAWIIKINE